MITLSKIGLTSLFLFMGLGAIINVYQNYPASTVTFYPNYGVVKIQPIYYPKQIDYRRNYISPIIPIRAPLQYNNYYNNYQYNQRWSSPYFQPAPKNYRDRYDDYGRYRDYRPYGMGPM